MEIIKTIEERVGECMHVHGNGYFVPRERYSDIITQDRQAILEALRERLKKNQLPEEEKKSFEEDAETGDYDDQISAQFNLGYESGIVDALATVDELLGGEVTE